jgi:hypothetical protein
MTHLLQMIMFSGVQIPAPGELCAFICLLAYKFG